LGCAVVFKLKIRINNKYKYNSSRQSEANQDEGDCERGPDGEVDQGLEGGERETESSTFRRKNRHQRDQGNVRKRESEQRRYKQVLVEFEPPSEFKRTRGLRYRLDF
jgi:hypothetical protein